MLLMIGTGIGVEVAVEGGAREIAMIRVEVGAEVAVREGLVLIGMCAFETAGIEFSRGRVV